MPDMPGMPGMGGGGGGGGGGAGGGASAPAPPPPKDKCGAEGEAGLAKGLLMRSGDFAWSDALRGLGGAMVPKRMEARCLALVPVGRSSSSEEEEGSSVESRTDHSSSSGRTREGRDEGGEEEVEGGSWWVRRWKGLVECSVVEDVVVGVWVEGACGAGAWGGPDSLDWLSFLKNGFLVSLL